jgi:hypothetical protein
MKKISFRPSAVHMLRLQLLGLSGLVLILIVGAVRYVPRALSVSSTVNGRDLPIYCVQTDKPQIALTFDAAWGARRLL